MSSVRRALVLLVAALVGCGGGEGSDCRASDECKDGLACAGPSEPQVCGIPAMEWCSADADCLDAGMLCHAVPDPCSPDGVGSECRLPCSEGGCVAGFVCDLDRGACVAQRCDQGFTCASQQACQPNDDPDVPVHARAHGCVAIACESDEPCGDGACVNGICQDGPGVCVVPEPVP